MFIDETILDCQGGRGGDGIKSFHREKYVAKGGPDGGDGGRGGHVILKASHDLHTLFDIEKKHMIKADSGMRGGPSQSTGKSGKDVILKVPLGTLIKDFESNDLIIDLSDTDQSHVVATGGEGGKGNSHYKSSTNRAPIKFTPGKSGEKKKLRLELKLMADCGLVGFPNAGKSSLIKKLSKATPKVADYAFTTLHPNLGIVNAKGGSFVMADIPGIIEGAAKGKGLGNQFLKHIERTSCLVFVLDSGKGDLWEEYQTLKQELNDFNKLILDRPKIILFNKCDLEMVELDGIWKKEGCPIFNTSSMSGEGLKALVEQVFDLIKNTRIRRDNW